MSTMLDMMQKSGFGSVLAQASVYDSKALEQAKVDNYNETIGHMNEKDGYHCERCKNRGLIAELRFIEIYDDYCEVLVPCKCVKVRNAIARLNRSGLSSVVKKYTFDNYLTPEEWQKGVKEAAERFCTDETGAWFFMGGQSGCGKTHLCTAIAVKAIKAGRNVRYMLWRDEIAKIKAAITDSEEYAALMDELKTADVLYIDDLFKTGKGLDGRAAFPTAADINAAFEIINYRYNRPDAITIISSERKLSQLAEIDEAIAGRISERSKPGGFAVNVQRDLKKNYRLGE